MHNTKWKAVAIIFFMSFYMNITVVSVAGVDGFNDIDNHWAKDKISKWTEEGRISGYPDGSFKPDDNITKAEFITLINNLYGYDEADGVNFSDVGSEAWYANQTAIAKSNRYMQWYQNNQLEPDEAISREDVSVIVAEILASKSNDPDTVLSSFEDGTMVEETHQSQVAALIEKGYLTGYPDGTYKPQGAITRAEVINLLDKVLGRTVTESGTVGNGSQVEVVDGNITVYKGDLTLTNVWIKGDLILTAEVADGDINLENVTIDGRIIVDGGDSQLHLKGSSISEILLVKKSGKSQVLSENSTVNKVISKSNVLLEGDFKNSEVEIQSSGHVVELDGTFASVEMKESATLEIKGDTGIDDLKVATEAAGSNINTSSGTTIKEVTFDGPAIVKGSVFIAKVVLNTDGVLVEPVVGEIEKNEATTNSEGVKVKQPSRGGGGTSTTTDTTPPTGYSASFDQSAANSSNQSSMSFTFSSAEVGASYKYSIDDTNGLTLAVIGNGTIATATDQVTGIDVSTLDDDTLTLTVTLVDAANNQGNSVSDTVIKETVAPTGYSVSIDQAAITASNETTMSFSFASAEVGSNYRYTIADTDNGTSDVTGSGSIVTATDQVVGINVSTLTNGTLTLHVQLTDVAGNEGNVALDTIIKESTPPSGFSASFDQDPVNLTNKTNISFTFALAEVGTTYNYSIDDTNAGTPAVTGSGTIATTTDQISGLDVSGLDDDTLTLTVYLTDSYGNQGNNVTDTVLKDTSEPSGYRVSIDSSYINSSNATAISFTFALAEVGATYSYSIDDTNGGTLPITGSGIIGTVTDQITGIDVSGLDDDTLTLTVYLTDNHGNQGGNTTDTATKETVVPSGYAVTLDQDPVTSANDTGVSFSFALAEVGTTYHYSIDDNNDGTSPITGSGGIITATDQVSSIDVSGLDDGTLHLSVTLTDVAGNIGVAATDSATKEATPPTGYSISFDQDSVIASNVTNVSFTFASAEVGVAYTYSIDDYNGGTPAVTGSGTITTATDQISGLDVSGLDDDTLTLTAYLTDAYGNQGIGVMDMITKDTVAPSGYSVSIDSSYINNTNATAMSFKFASAEVGTTYHYTIDDTNGATAAITGSGVIETATDQITDIDVSGLADDILTLTVYLTDSAGNQGSDATDTVTKETVPPSGYTVTLDQDPVTSSNDTTVSFTFASAQVDADYAYSISDGSSQVTGSGTITTATDQISSIDVSGLADGTLNLSVTLTDAAGNIGVAATDSATKEATPPSGYSASFDQDSVIESNVTNVSFTFASAEVGATYTYSIDDTNAGTPAITGSGTIATATDQISGLDVSGLDDDTLTLTAYLTDSYGNQGDNVTDTVLKDTSEPSGYSVSIDSSYINNTNATAMSFKFASAEVGTTYHYTIDDTNGVTAAITGSGTIATATDQITGLDVSGLADDILTLTVYLTDSAGNQGSNATDTVTKETVPPSGYTVTLDQDPVTSANDTTVSFTFASAQVDADYAYSISDGSSQVTGSGTIGTATDQINSIDVSGLADGTLNLSVTLTDAAGNIGLAATDSATKKAIPPSGYSVSFDQDSVIPSNEFNISFAFALAEVGATYTYSIDDTNAGTPAVTGSGTIATATDQISGLDVSGLDDDMLTLTAYLTDAYGNQGDNVTDTVLKDTSVPSGYSVNMDPSYINSTNATAISFTFALAEADATYYYSIDDTNGATAAVTGSGTIATTTDQITGIDVSGLDDDTITLSVYLTDGFGNTGNTITDTVTKETVVPSGYTVTLDQDPVTSDNETAISFTFASAEVGATYNYSIDDANGAISAITGSGTIEAATDQITGIDVSGLDSGTLNLNVTLTDIAGNVGIAATDSVVKSANVPNSYTATCASDPSDDYAQTYEKAADVNGKPSYNYYHNVYGANFTILWDAGDNRWELQDDSVSAGYDPVVHYHNGTGDTPPIGPWININGIGDISLNAN